MEEGEVQKKDSLDEGCRNDPQFVNVNGDGTKQILQDDIADTSEMTDEDVDVDYYKRRIDKWTAVGGPRS